MQSKLLFSKVCGDDYCCFTPWMQAAFREGETTRLSGGTIHECYKFKISEGSFTKNNTTLGKIFTYNFLYILMAN